MSELEIWNELGNIYFNTGSYDEAIRTYQKAIELDHGCGQSYSNLATIYIRQGRSADAIPMLQKGIELLEEAGSQAILWNQLGEAYRKLDDYDNATVSYRKAAELDPENTTYQDNLAEAEQDGHRVDSQPITETGNPRTETASWVFKKHGLVYPPEEDSSGAPEGSPMILGSRIFSDAPNQDNTGGNTSDLAENSSPARQPEGKAPTNAHVDGLLMLGLKHWHKQEYERAIQFLETALITVVRPKDNFLEALCYYAIALVETDQGKIVEAIQAFQSAASLAPEHIFPWNSLGNLNCMLDQYDDALAAFREGIEHNPKDAVSWNGLGDVYHKLGRFEDAVAAYQLGNVFEKQNIDEDILKEYEKSIEASRENPKVWNEAGNIYYNTGAYDDAISSYCKAIELDPNEITFQANLSKAKQALEQANNRTEAPMPEIALGNLLNSESAIAKPASPLPEDKMAIPSEPDRPEQTREAESLPEELSTLPSRTADREPEAAYWVFNTEPALGNVLPPAAQCTVGAETVVSTTKPVPALSKRSHNKQVFPDGQSRPGAHMDTTALMVQLTPRPANPTKTEDKIFSPNSKNDWKCATAVADTEARKPSASIVEASADNPALPTVEPGNQVADQTPINFHVLENDIAAYRKITEINPRNDRAWDALGNMYEAAGLHSEAISAFEQAIALAPRKEAYHFHLGIALAYQMHYEKAIQALQNSLALNPNFMLAHCALAANYRRVGNESEAQEHIAIARPSMELEKEYNRACFESISGDADQAFALLEIALVKEQIQIAMLRSDPDLDFIRSDKRFEALLNKIMSVVQ